MPSNVKVQAFAALRSRRRAVVRSTLERVDAPRGSN